MLMSAATESPAVVAKRERLSRRQQAFRAEFRGKISKLYSGWVHVALIYAIGGALIWYCVRQMTAPAWYEWLVVPAAFVISNVFEWWIHKYVMHRPVPGLMGIYKRHTLAHHQFFTENEYTVDNSRDFRIVFFPPYALVTFIVISLVPWGVLQLLGFPNAAWLVLITNTFLYLNYELFHYCCHVKDDRLVRHIPLVNSIRRHHIAHHNTAIMMERNFNLTYPIADWFFGTSDLKCGLIQHIFNGYNGRFVRTDLRRVRHTKDDPKAGTPRVAPMAAE
jgi:Fatty acid hydroxylase superfamily